MIKSKISFSNKDYKNNNKKNNLITKGFWRNINRKFKKIIIIDYYKIIKMNKVKKIIQKMNFC